VFSGFIPHGMTFLKGKVCEQTCKQEIRWTMCSRKSV
jgi:hypothetical protein